MSGAAGIEAAAIRYFRDILWASRVLRGRLHIADTHG